MHTITLRCPGDQKGTYVRAARAAHQTLEAWCLAALADAVPPEIHHQLHQLRHLPDTQRPPDREPSPLTEFRHTLQRQYAEQFAIPPELLHPNPSPPPTEISEP